MSAFLKLKEKILYKKITPKPFKNFRFINFSQINHKSFYKLISSARIRKNLKTNYNITYEKHLSYVKNYKNKKIIDFILICKNTKKIIGLFSIKKTIIGYEIGKSILNKKFLGKGIAKKGTIRLIDFFFNYFKKKTIYAVTSTQNYKNINLNNKLGFKISDIRKKYYIMKLSYVRFYNFCFKKK
ncbi:MAG: N-acetyltransferase [Candidatus Pelagibacter sp. TMED118]|nr:MAG: N-acetyltransferase [Candidatus Pelagibacter sp. TMED118]|tara:strand:- start:531 stop:1082 length:552 start_codon:yes stop_codon:yes gene_type:complete